MSADQPLPPEKNQAATGFRRQPNFFDDSSGAPASAEPKTPRTALRLPSKFTVTQITRFIKQTLMAHLPGSITVEGEISNLRQPASGHCYFDLKDANAILPAVVWRSSFQRIKFQPSDGQAVIASGAIDLYEPHGKYQLVVESLTPAGMGALELAFRQLAEKLRAEGFFDEAHKKPMPRYPQTIAIVTSATGAAIRDIHQTIMRRYPIVRLLLYPAAVQGDAAAKEIAAGIRYFNRHAARWGGIDLMIVGRGGGSIEDLWAFNEEMVARAIYASDIPIISAVGHEVDTTIADFVADQRAATPTAAAELAVPVLSEVRENLTTAQQRLEQGLAGQLRGARRHLEQLARRPLFLRPLTAVYSRLQTLDHQTAHLDRAAGIRLHKAIRRVQEQQQSIAKIEPHRVWAYSHTRLLQLGWQLEQRREAFMQKYRFLLEQRTTRLTLESPQRDLDGQRERLTHEQRRLHQAWRHYLERTDQRLDYTQRQLQNLNPRTILRRGYSITRRQSDQSIVTPACLPAANEIIVTEFAEQHTISSKVLPAESPANP